jgi:hypothetical protein
MTNWYIRNNDQHLGPYSIEELKLVGIYNDDFVWKEGLEHWTKAETLAELKDMVVSLEHDWKSRPMFSDPEITYSTPKEIVKQSLIYRMVHSLRKTLSSFFKNREHHTSGIF